MYLELGAITTQGDFVLSQNPNQNPRSGSMNPGDRKDKGHKPGQDQQTQTQNPGQKQQGADASKDQHRRDDAGHSGTNRSGR